MDGMLVSFELLDSRDLLDLVDVHPLLCRTVSCAPKRVETY